MPISHLAYKYCSQLVFAHCCILPRALRRHLKEASNAFDTQHQLHTFSIGIKGSPDLLAARKVADHLGTNHHEFTFTVQEGIDALPNLIYHIESYEQVRAAVPMYLLSRKIKALGIKVVLSGEGADEAFGGYLYFHKVHLVVCMWWSACGGRMLQW